MVMWNSLSLSRRPPRPKSEENLSQQLACMCYRLQHLNRCDGLGCLKCMTLYQRNIEADSWVRHMYGNNLNCTYEVCHYSCAVLYYRSQAKRLVVQVKTQHEEAFVSMTQTKLSTFKGFKSTIVDLTVQNSQDKNGSFSR